MSFEIIKQVTPQTVNRLDRLATDDFRHRPKAEGYIRLLIKCAAIRSKDKELVQLNTLYFIKT